LSSLAIISTIPAITPEALEKVRQIEKVLAGLEEAQIKTEHLIHGGMYARTVRIGPGVMGTNVVINRPTMLIINGPIGLLVGEGWVEFVGYNVIAASSGRKQIFFTRGAVEVTMIFPTAAKTVAEAEAEFTDEAEGLLSRRQDGNETITVTGE
jgi:hypothetical protein